MAGEIFMRVNEVAEELGVWQEATVSTVPAQETQE